MWDLSRKYLSFKCLQIKKLWFVSSWVILLNLQEIVFTIAIFFPITLLCFVTLWITRNVLTFVHLASRLLTAASACCISVVLEVCFVFFVLACLYCVNHRIRWIQKKVPLNFKWMETNLHHIVVDFISVTNLIREGVFQKILYSTLPQCRLKDSLTLCQI
jgi:hypothetical protein